MSSLSHVSQFQQETSGGNEMTYFAAADASRAVELPLVRIEFCWVKNSRSSKGTPRRV